MKAQVGYNNSFRFMCSHPLRNPKPQIKIEIPHLLKYLSLTFTNLMDHNNQFEPQSSMLISPTKFRSTYTHSSDNQQSSDNVIILKLTRVRIMLINSAISWGWGFTRCSSSWISISDETTTTTKKCLRMFRYLAISHLLFGDFATRYFSRLLALDVSLPVFFPCCSSVYSMKKINIKELI